MNAAETYAARRNDIARLIEVLEMELETHDASHAAAPGNWALVGDLDKVRADLVNTVGFVASMDPPHVEAFLAE